MPELRADGTLTNLVSGGLLSNSQTGMGYGASNHTRVGSAYLLTEIQLRSLYRSSWLIRRVCDLPAFDMTKKQPELVIADDDGEMSTAIMNRWASPIERDSPFSRRASYGFSRASQEAERWARLFGGAYIVLKCNGDEDQAEPLMEVQSLDAIAVLDCYSMRPSTRDYNRSDPEFYDLVHDRNKQLGVRSGTTFHESRVLPYYGNRIHPYDQQSQNIPADSVVQGMFESFQRHYEVMETVREAVNSFSLMSVSINNLTELLAAGKESVVKSFLQEVGLQKSLYRVLVTDSEASSTGFEGRNLSGVKENVELFKEDLTASAYPLPYYKLWGTVGRAGLSDSGANESRAYAEAIATERNSKHRTNDERVIKILGQLESGELLEGFEVNYPSIYEPTEAEQLDSEEKRSRIYQTYSTIPGAVTSEEFRKAIATGQPLESVINLDDDSQAEEAPEEESFEEAIAEALEGEELERADAVDQDELDRVFAKYKRTVNMSASELERWSTTVASKQASLDRSPIKRNLRLLRKNKEDWTDADIRDANKTISFVSRMRGVSQGRPISEDVPYSKRNISLKNWAFDPGKRSDDNAASTPAEPSERIKGSAINEPGAASNARGGITVSESVEDALRAKVEDHNEANDKDWQRATLGMLKAVYKRGEGAFSTSHRPGMNRQQWAMGRVNAFLRLLSTGRPKNRSYTSDNDLLPSGHKRSARSDAVEPLSFDGEILSDDDYEAIASISEQDVLGIIEEALGEPEQREDAKRCKRGLPCGDTCISRKRTCKKNNSANAQGAMKTLGKGRRTRAERRAASGGSNSEGQPSVDIQSVMGGQEERARAAELGINDIASVNGSRKQLIDDFGEEKVKLAEQGMRDALTQSQVHVAVPSSVLDQIIDDGRLRSSLDIPGKGSDYNQKRADVESNLFNGQYDNRPASDRPIYGYYAEAGGSLRGDNTHLGPSQYGDAVIRLRSDVKDRSTAVAGDSFANGRVTNPNDFNIGTTDAFGMTEDRLNTMADRNASFSDKILSSSGNYLEAHVHGQVQMNRDVEEILFRNASSVTPKVRQWAQDNGVRITIEE